MTEKYNDGGFWDKEDHNESQKCQRNVPPPSTISGGESQSVTAGSA